ncbi:hypothetical protein GVAV_002693 [Gurleya vavrai]
MLIFISFICATGVSTNLCPSNPLNLTFQSSEIRNIIVFDKVIDASKFMQPFYEKIENEKSQEETSDDEFYDATSDIEAEMSEEQNSDLEFYDSAVHNSIKKTRIHITNPDYLSEIKKIIRNSIRYKKLDYPTYFSRMLYEEKMKTDNFENNLENPSYYQDIYSEGAQKIESLRSKTIKADDPNINKNLMYHEINVFLNEIGNDNHFEKYFSIFKIRYLKLIQMEFFEFVNYFEFEYYKYAKDYSSSKLKTSDKLHFSELKIKNIFAEMNALIKKFSDDKIPRDDEFYFKIIKYTNDVMSISAEIDSLNNEPDATKNSDKENQNKARSEPTKLKINPLKYDSDSD